MIRRIFIFAALLFVMTALTIPAWAESSHGPVGLSWDAVNWSDFGYASDEAREEYAQYGVHLPGPPLIAIFFNFALLALLLYFIARKPLTEYLKARSDSVREGLAQAKELLEEANERLADYSARLERMDEEMSKLREEFIASGEAERDRLVSDATLKADRMRREAETRLQQEFAQLREELRTEMIDKAVNASTKALKMGVKETDQRRLADEYLKNITEQGTAR